MASILIFSSNSSLINAQELLMASIAMPSVSTTSSLTSFADPKITIIDWSVMQSSSFWISRLSTGKTSASGYERLQNKAIIP